MTFSAAKSPIQPPAPRISSTRSSSGRGVAARCRIGREAMDSRLAGTPSIRLKQVRRCRWMLFYWPTRRRMHHRSRRKREKLRIARRSMPDAAKMTLRRRPRLCLGKMPSNSLRGNGVAPISWCPASGHRVEIDSARSESTFAVSEPTLHMLVSKAWLNRQCSRGIKLRLSTQPMDWRA
jgi:hypothetical protein